MINEEKCIAQENLENVTKELMKLKKATFKFKSESIGIKELIEIFPNSIKLFCCLHLLQE
ncbi:hypothetical protein [Bacillus sp. NEB1478]|uniref:hypothetical protein n=1 Tax=Bacillus sp. NEB1478 TaxID=3073816 RepID=UPI0028730FA7|nr:hypothetical protein [Bacillus sp. NEB1478]WNB90935.1 hypothetical protein RGB74_13585 [Bacillus sp. NEB1478]